MKTIKTKTLGLFIGLILSLFTITNLNSQIDAYAPFTLFNHLGCDVAVTYTVYEAIFCTVCQTGGTTIQAGQPFQILSFASCVSTTSACDIVIEVTQIGSTGLTAGTCVSTFGGGVFLNVTRYNVPTVTGCTSSGVSYTIWSNADWQIVP